MNTTLIFITFLAVNLDFFFILLFLLERYRTRDVMVGYLLGIAILLVASFCVGKALALLLPEWVLGILGFLPIYMALHDNDEEPGQDSHHSPVVATLVTYLAVCSGCNLSIFLPVLTGENYREFALTVAFVLFLAAMAVVLIKRFGALTVVKRLLNRYGEVLMKTVYIGVGLYVFYDSGLLVHIINLV
jgi:cadmium resistance protein CadD (predicted permease)